MEIVNELDDILLEGCICMTWSPRGVFLFLFFASRKCSLNRSRTRRFDSPMYTAGFSSHKLHVILYTTFLVWQRPRRPASHVWHLFVPAGHGGRSRADLTMCLATVFPLTRHGRGSEWWIYDLDGSHDKVGSLDPWSYWIPRGKNMLDPWSHRISRRNENKDRICVDLTATCSLWIHDLMWSRANLYCVHVSCDHMWSLIKVTRIISDDWWLPQALKWLLSGNNLPVGS